jgi:3-hydroxyisobutyrate dehydrogenase-like beta-hydroxyacid dehydrogenase
MRVGIVHPGAMGTTLGAALLANGHDVGWASVDRSEATRRRADADGLVDHSTTVALSEQCDVIISVCPPVEAAAVAAEFAQLGFTGCYLDANAIAPTTAREIAGVLSSAGATFVDGAIIGPPARHRGLTVLYLSGDAQGCADIADLFHGSVVDTHRVEGGAGAASAVKMAFAAWTKGTSALLIAIRALAESEGVVEDLEHAWSVLTPDLADRLPGAVRATAPKAWRFVGEMEEIASTFSDAGLPSGFHEAAAQVYSRLADLRGRHDVDIDEVMTRLVTRRR